MKMVPKGFGDLKIILTEYYLDKPPKDRQRAMVAKYLNDQIPANFWELAYEPPGEPSHWRRLGFLDKHLAILRQRGEPESFAVAAQMFAGEDLAWGEIELQSSAEVLGACVYMGRLDGATGESSWENYNVANTAIFPDYFEEGLARLQSGEPEPEPEPEAEAPRAEINITPSGVVMVGQTVQFDGRNSANADSYLWEVVGPNTNKFFPTAMVHHRFEIPGEYLAKLLVENVAGKPDFAEATITVMAFEYPEPEPEPEPTPVPTPGQMSGLPMVWVAFLLILELVAVGLGVLIASL
jgi:hypothetical protein